MARKQLQEEVALHFAQIQGNEGEGNTTYESASMLLSPCEIGKASEAASGNGKASSRSWRNSCSETEPS